MIAYVTGRKLFTVIPMLTLCLRTCRHARCLPTFIQYLDAGCRMESGTGRAMHVADFDASALTTNRAFL